MNSSKVGRYSFRFGRSWRECNTGSFKRPRSNLRKIDLININGFVRSINVYRSVNVFRKSSSKLEMLSNDSAKLGETLLVSLKHFPKLKIESVIWKSRFANSYKPQEQAKFQFFSLVKLILILILMRSSILGIKLMKFDNHKNLFLKI